MYAWVAPADFVSVGDVSVLRVCMGSLSQLGQILQSSYLVLHVSVIQFISTINLKL